MRGIKRALFITILALLAWCAAPQADSPQKGSEKRKAAEKLQKDGNFKEAYEAFSELALDPNGDPKEVGKDLRQALTCLHRLNRQNEFDAFRENVIEIHSTNWRLLQTVANGYLNANHQGFLVAGEFKRGPHRGGGKQADSSKRDRIRALQLMEQAMAVITNETDNHALATFYLDFAYMWIGHRYDRQNQAWRLQYLSDLSELPDYEEAYYNPWSRGQNTGASVHPDGTPVFHHLPTSYEAAKTDGERWRWCLLQTMETDSGRKKQVLHEYAQFLQSQFGVQTMASYGWYFRQPQPDPDKKAESGTYELHTLSDGETIAKLASGVKRFKLPNEFNHIKIFQEVAETGYNTQHHENPLHILAQIFENRRQYDKAASYWKRSVEEKGPGPDNRTQKRLDQIVKNWGRFENIMSQPAGKGATVDYLFRNGEKVEFIARKIDAEKLLNDVKSYLKSNPRTLERNKIQIENLGYGLLEKERQKYVGEKVASWSLDLKPRPGHFDKRITVTTPLQKAGAYLLTAKMHDGNTSNIVIWLNDTAIVKKPLSDLTSFKNYFFVADAVTGKPVPKANIEFFGYRRESVKNWTKVLGRRYNIRTTHFAEFTDEQGQAIPDPEDFVRDYSYIITATTSEGRFAYLGFSGIWNGNYYDREYNETKPFLITDRPVYRPEQPVKFKFWVRHAKYDQEDTSSFANQSFQICLNNPKGEKILEKTFTADAYGGFDGEYLLPDEATLGVYSLQINISGWRQAGTFRVEEYKKPEFEVTVEAPTEPVMLGEIITATITAKYYFGAPVTEAKVKYKVLRSNHSANWYPTGRWDWFYNPGYWWFASDYNWYPGWRHWGCMKPRYWWAPADRTPPEVIAENEVEIGKDGTVKIEIDTSMAKEMHGDIDHRYEITAEVVDQSRRTIVGKGKVLVARKPFKVYAWVDRGHYRVGDTIRADFSAQTLDQKPVIGKGELTLYRITYDKDGLPDETPAQNWSLDTGLREGWVIWQTLGAFHHYALSTNDAGRASILMAASRAGQYRLAYTLTDKEGHAIEGGYVFTIRGEGFDGREFRFNNLELVTDKREYKAGDTVRLAINTDRVGSTVVLFVRPANGIYLPPKIIQLKGKSAIEEIAVVKKDMPNFYIEAVTIADGRVHTATREVIVPPEKRILNVEVLPSAETYMPGEEAKVKVKLTDFFGEPFIGSLALSIYDKSVEYISGGSNIPEIKAFFWKWRRRHNPRTETNLARPFGNLIKSGTLAMRNLGVFGHGVASDLNGRSDLSFGIGNARGAFVGTPISGPRPVMRFKGSAMMEVDSIMPAMEMAQKNDAYSYDSLDETVSVGDVWQIMGGNDGEASDNVEPTVRTNFADTALWVGALETDTNGVAEVELTMPENLTGWKIRTWAMGHGTKVGEGTAEVVTTKNLLLRLQAPRFFVEKDEVVLSANIHNYLKTTKTVTAVLELDGSCLEHLARSSWHEHPAHVSLQGENEKTTMKHGQDAHTTKEHGQDAHATKEHEQDAHATQVIEIEAGGEARVDWRVKVLREGEAVVRMKALTDEESDAMEMRFPVYVHGMLKMDSFSGVLRADDKRGTLTIDVPEERRPEQSRLEVRYSPTLAGAMVDALPYLAEYPYGCTEQTLNRFIPTVITQKILLDMGLDLADIRDKRTNLNAQEIGDDKERMADWKRLAGKKRWNGTEWVPRNPVFDEKEVDRMVKDGLKRLTAMQLSDGGWGWFSGYGERSYPHTTAVVVHGLQTALQNDVALVPGVLERGVKWLQNYQDEQIRKIKNWEKNPRWPNKRYADNLDAFVYMVLCDAKIEDKTMREFLYRDRTHLAVYAKAMFGMAMHKQGHIEERDNLIRNIEQYLVEDDENQTAYLKLPNSGYWWYWYGSEYEAQGYYLKLLALTDPKGQKASRLVKYLLNNRRHATYWKSTRDTAICLEAFADFIRASGEDEPDLTIQIFLDGKKQKQVKVTKENLFSFDNKFVLTGDAVKSGEHKIELRKKGVGPLYYNAYLTNFTLEDHITKAGLEVKVNRKYYKLEKVDKEIKVVGSRGQALDQKVEKYKRHELANLDTLKSGDLVEIELTIESKNDYEYLVVEDMKAAGFEPFEIRSGYNGNEMNAYMELRDERVAFFLRTLARGTHSISYRMRAEIPGKFSALPTKISAMYAPELKGNSEEIKLNIVD